MVFELTDELIAYDQSEERLIIECLSNLLLGYYESNHLLIASPIFCAYFTPKITESRASRALHHLSHNTYMLPNVLWTKKVLLDKNVNKNDDNLPISFFKRTIAIQPMTLLCENLLDVDFYTKLCRHYYFTSYFRINGIMGGGHTTGDVFTRLKSRNQISLTILDSDVNYPGASKGSTARRVEKHYKNKLAHVGLYILNVHEIENLIPFLYIEKKSKTGARWFLEAIKKAKHYEVMRFYDIKHGYRTKEVDDNKDLRNYVSSLYNILFPKKSSNFDKYLKDCIRRDNRLFQNCRPQIGVFPELNSSMLEDFLNESNISFNSDIFESERKYIADLIFTYACARADDIIM